MKIVDSSFGKRLELELDKDVKMLVVCTNDGRGLMPFCVKLVHQLYIKEILKWRGRQGDVAVIPITEETISLFWGRVSGMNGGPLYQLLSKEELCVPSVESEPSDDFDEELFEEDYD